MSAARLRVDERVQLAPVFSADYRLQCCQRHDEQVLKTKHLGRELMVISFADTGQSSKQVHRSEVPAMIDAVRRIARA
jgi:hypothetical protein